MPTTFIFRNTLILFLAICTEICYAQKQLKITGHAPNLADGTEIYLLPLYPNRYTERQKRESKAVMEKQSMIVKNGQFNTTVNIRNGEVYTLRGKNIKGFKTVCLAEGAITFNIQGTSLSEATFTGNETAAAYESYYKNYFGSDIYKAAGNARIAAKVSNSAKDISLSEKLMDSLNKVSRKNAMAHFKAYPNSYANAALLNSQGFSEQEKKEIFNSFPKSIADNSYGDNLRFYIDSLFIGSYAPRFTQNDTAGNAVRLDSFRGKYVLIDFWASWCVPCRAENPHLVTAIDTYGKKNFSIIGVSLDDNKKAWLDAIKADGLNWTQVSDLKKYDNEVSVNYGIFAIPANFLLDPSGKIIAKNLRGKELLEVLGKVIK